MRTRAKICGLTTAADRDAAVAAGASAVGFIAGVPVDTERELTVDRARELAATTPPFVTSVLVTVPETVEAAVGRHERVGADAVQVHGGLSPTEVGQFATAVDAGVLAAVHNDDPELRAYADAADAVLVDSGDEEGMGGTGRTHDWARTRELVETLDTPVVLAGGLDPSNVRQAVETVEPFAVDVASGVEAEPGHKDHAALERFIQHAREVPA